MFYSHLSIVIRNTFGSKYNGINIVGLSIGLAVTALVLLYARHEFSYDRFHEHHRNIVRISGKQSDTWFATLPPMHSGVLLSHQLPEVEKVVRLRRWPPKYISNGKEKFYESRVLFTDSGSKFFELFQFPLMYGRTKTALDENNSAAVTESVAMRLFGRSEVTGEVIQYDTMQLRITAVLKELPSNTHLNFSVLICNDRAMANAKAHFTYGLLTKTANRLLLQQKLMAITSPMNKSEHLQDCQILSLDDLHFDSNMTFEMRPPGNKAYLYIFLLIGLMILVLSCFNFINLSIALYAHRSKEIAVRKVIGASRSSIAKQFLLEAVFISMICVPLALAWLEFLLPYFNDYMGIRLENIFLQGIAGFASLLLLSAIIGLLAGLYPAVVLPRIHALVLFKKGLTTSLKGSHLRSCLVGFQITMLVMILSGSWVIHQQLSFIQKKDLGFTHEGVIKLRGAGMMDSLQFARIKAELLLLPSVVHVSHGLAPGDEDYGTPYQTEGSTTIHSDLIAFPVDKEYIATMGIQLLETDFRSLGENTASRIVLVNETLAKQLGRNCIGQQIVLYPGKEYEAKRTVNGIFRDFHFFSLHQPVVPMMLILRQVTTKPNENVLVKFQSRNLPETVASIAATARKVVTDIPLTPQLLDDSLTVLYDKEKKLSFFCMILLGVAVALSALGLVGLASHSAEARTKEIGIRKILGASITQLITILSAPFVRMAAIAWLVGCLLSYQLGTNWLQGFAYAIKLDAIPYLLTGVSILAILLLTVGLRTLTASLANPTESLRSE